MSSPVLKIETGMKGSQSSEKSQLMFGLSC